MPSSTAPPASISDAQLKQCINLVTQVSYRAKNKEFKQRGPADIRARTNDNGWHTWWYSTTAGGPINACAFFQYIRMRPIAAKVYNYAMCIGFDNSFPMGSDADCQAFLNTVVGGTSGDGLLWDCIKNVLQVQKVYVVDAPELAAAALYNARRDRLFSYMQQKSPGAKWSMTLDPKNDTNVGNSFWGGDGLNLWTLTPT